MFTEERQAKILQIIKERNRVLVGDLTRGLKVSDSTIRRDLRELEEGGLLRRTHGGAVSLDFTNYEPTLSEKELENLNEKISIGEKAAGYIHRDETIMLDSGSTTLEIAKAIKGKTLTVVTNSIQIAAELITSDTITVILTGGSIRRETGSLVGPIAERNISELRVDKVFLGTNGISSGDGFTTPNMYEGRIKELMITSANEKFIVADHTKFGKTYFSKFADLKDMDYIITDDGLDFETANKFKNSILII